MGIFSNLVKTIVIGPTPTYEERKAAGIGRAQQAIDEQNALFAFYEAHGIINGTPGRVDDRTIHRACEQIRRDYDSGKINNDQAYARADALYPTIDNNHADGVAAHHAHHEVSRLLDHILKDC